MSVAVGNTTQSDGKYCLVKTREEYAFRAGEGKREVLSHSPNSHPYHDIHILAVITLFTDCIEPSPC